MVGKMGVPQHCHAVERFALLFFWCLLIVQRFSVCQSIDSPSNVVLEGCSDACKDQCEAMVSTRVKETTLLRSAMNSKLRDQVKSLKSNWTLALEKLDNCESRQYGDGTASENTEKQDRRATSTKEETDSLPKRSDHAEKLAASEKVCTESREQEIEEKIASLQSQLELSQKQLATSEAAREELGRLLKEAQERESEFLRRTEAHHQGLKREMELMATSHVKAKELEVEVSTLEKKLQSHNYEKEALATNIQNHEVQTKTANDRAYQLRRELFLANEIIRQLNQTANSQHVNVGLLLQDCLRLTRNTRDWIIEKASPFYEETLKWSQPFILAVDNCYDQHVSAHVELIIERLRKLPAVSLTAKIISESLDEMHETEIEVFRKFSRAALDFLELVDVTDELRIIVDGLRYSEANTKEANTKEALQCVERRVKILVVVGLSLLLLLRTRKTTLDTSGGNGEAKRGVDLDRNGNRNRLMPQPEIQLRQ